MSALSIVTILMTLSPGPIIHYLGTLTTETDSALMVKTGRGQTRQL